MSQVWPKKAVRLALLAICSSGLAGSALAQGLSEQQMRCLQLQQELAAVQGGGANREELGRIEQQIAQADRVFQGTQAAMEDAGCFESFFIFGRGLVRSPKCLKMNDRVEDARRQLVQLQQQRQALMGGGGNRRRQAELQDALARSGCGGVRTPPPRRGLFDIFGGDREEVQELPQTPIYRSIDPNGRYRTVCVRLCDGFYFPIHYSAYGSQIGQDAQKCQESCAAPAELYVYRNPGQEIEQAVSLSGSAYMDLPVALRFKKEYVKGCSCKQAEYNPTEIEAANKRAEAGDTAAQPAATAAAPSQEAVPGETPQLDLEITGSNEPAPPPQEATDAAAAAIPDAQQPPPPQPAAEAAPPSAAIPEAQQPPPPPPAAEAAPPPPPPAPTAEAAPPPAPVAATPPADSTVIKRKPAAAPPPASPFGPQ